MKKMKPNLNTISNVCHKIAIKKESKPTWHDLALINDEVDALIRKLQRRFKAGENYVYIPELLGKTKDEILGEN